MSLVIYVSTNTVIIPKYNLEFRFTPPSIRLTEAAIETYGMLRQSEALQVYSSREQREEVITLLKHYGHALFVSVIPEHIRSQVQKAGGIFIYSLDQDIIDLPWELLFDGTSFFALTQGVVRINKSEDDRPVKLSSGELQKLKLSLNSFTPLEDLSPCSRFTSFVEDIQVNAIPNTDLVDVAIDGNSSRISLENNLRHNPNVFLFSGYEEKGSWIVTDSADNSDKWMEETLQTEMREAVNNGLRVLFLNTSSFLEKNPSLLYKPVRFFLDAGVPCILTLNGRIDRGRFNLYFNTFIYNLIREESILRAHRVAINSIQSSLALSWDWSWIRLHLNQKLLDKPTEHPLPPFHFDRGFQQTMQSGGLRTNQSEHLCRRRFSGSYKDYQAFSSALSEKSASTIISVNLESSSLASDYLYEYVRRLSSKPGLHLSVFHYQKWGYSNGSKSRLATSKFSKLFGFLAEAKLQQKMHEGNLFEILKPAVSDQGEKILVLMTPPLVKDPLLDQWLQKKQTDGWKIVCFFEKGFATSLKKTVLSLNEVSQSQLFRSFEDDFPEEWIDRIEKKIPPQMQNVGILKLIKYYGDPSLINLVCEKKNLSALIEEAFPKIIGSLSAARLKIVTVLYLVRSSISKALLLQLVGEKSIDGDLRYLYKINLVSSDLNEENFWIPINLHHRIHSHHLIPETSKRAIGQEILQKLLVYLDKHPNDHRKLEVCFLYCLFELVHLGVLENPIQRYLQFGKKLAKRVGDDFNFVQVVEICLEMAIQLQKGQLIQKTLLSVVEILEHLPFGEETIKICEWLLKIETKHRNWQLVSEIQTRIATIYIRLNRKEKAIGLISSAAKLNNDIKNYASRYQNLITIALLLLDLEEFDRLMKLMSSANFEVSLLNKEDLAKLWLIDGHMLFNKQKYRESKASLEKVLEEPQIGVSATLQMKTYLYLAEIHQQTNNKKEYLKYLEFSIPLVEEAQELERASEIHQILYDEHLQMDNLTKAAKHLEWIYEFNIKAQNKNLARELADKLGGLYFKIGEHTKSTDFYSIAQGI